MVDNSTESWFRFFDKNHDGLISFSEFVKAMKDLGIELSESDYEALMDRLDVHQKDKSIDLREFLSFVDVEKKDDSKQRQIEIILQHVKANVHRYLETNPECGIPPIDLHLDKKSICNTRRFLLETGTQLSLQDVIRLGIIFDERTDNFIDYCKLAPVDHLVDLDSVKRHLRNILMGRGASDEDFTTDGGSTFVQQV